jgi:hypothetical protein
MKYLTSAIIAATFALSSVPVLAADTQGTDIEASTRLTLKECLALQAAKNDGTSRIEMKKACKWTADENRSNALSSSEKPRAVDSAPYGLLPGTVTPPP